MEYLNFKKKPYPVRSIYLDNHGLVQVSTLSLNNELFHKDGTYVSEDANNIDADIFFYLEDEMIGLPDAQLLAYLADMLAC